MSEAAQWKYTYQIAPIQFVNGIAGPGATLSIVSITQAADYPIGPTGQSNSDVSLDRYFANFVPYDGQELFKGELGKYPFANQGTASNAQISEPLNFSISMICPVNTPGGLATKSAIILALETAFDNHRTLGGTYNVFTPFKNYIGSLLLRMTAVNPIAGRVPSPTYRLEFEQPLVTLNQVEAAQNALMNTLTAQTQLTVPPGNSPWSNQPVNNANPSNLSSAALQPIQLGTALAGPQVQPPLLPSISTQAGATLGDGLTAAKQF